MRNAVSAFRRRRNFKVLPWAAAAVLFLFFFKGCFSGYWRFRLIGGEIDVIATGYCNCGKCCSWHVDENGASVYSYGKMKGRPKVVGMTSSGAMATRGTVAADTSVIPMGSRIFVPGYGAGVVEDTGGDIVGNRIDLWFPTHEEARAWGRKKVRIRLVK